MGVYFDWMLHRPEGVSEETFHNNRLFRVNIEYLVKEYNKYKEGMGDALEEEKMEEGSGYEDYLKRYHERLKEMNANPELLKIVTIDQVNAAAAEQDIDTIDTVYEVLFNKE